MQSARLSFSALLALGAALAIGTPAWALTGVQVGASGKTYASAAVQCALNPITGMAPMVQAGLYNPKKGASAAVSLNGNPIATVTFQSPDTSLWLVNGPNTAVVALDRKTADSYSFDATSSQTNYCIPDTRGNFLSGALEYAASQKSYATVQPGCAWNSRTGLAQPFVNLFDNGTYLLNVSVNNVALTQLSSLRKSTPVFLAAGLNVISAANAAISTDYYVRDGGAGTCTLP
ncbi:MAG TPA: hypothetical protein PK359_06670 [Burkholderiaceae bacterium]|mgnify:CR=1 FL=1|jgi:hypothetical protein|nr:hypothetical protein [Burkholderiaceae bacterium]